MLTSLALARCRTSDSEPEQMRGGLTQGSQDRTFSGLAARTSLLRAGTSDPALPLARLTRRPDSDAGRPLAGLGRALRPAPAWAAGAPAASARDGSHPGPAAASWPSSGELRNVLGARRFAGSDP